MKWMFNTPGNHYVSYCWIYRSSRNSIFYFSFKKDRNLILTCIWLVPKCWNHPSFINISPTIVIDTSVDRSSRVLLQHGNPKIWKRSKLNLDLYFQSCSSYWYINGKVYTSTTPWEDTLVFLLSCFVSNVQLILCTMNWCNYAIHKYSCRFQNWYIWVLTIWQHRGCIVVPSMVDI